MLEPQFTPLFILLTCLVFAWIGYMGHDDDDPQERYVMIARKNEMRS